MQDLKDLKDLKPGDRFFYKNTGYGLTSYERGDDAVEIRNGKLFTKTFDREGLEWVGGRWRFDGGLGLVTTIVGPDDERAVAECEAEGR